jgi:hypothetical protein
MSKHRNRRRIQRQQQQAIDHPETDKGGERINTFDQEGKNKLSSPTPNNVERNRKNSSHREQQTIRKTQHTSENPIERYSRQLVQATAGLILVGAITAIILLLQYCTLTDTEITNQSVERAFVTVSNLRQEQLKDRTGKLLWRYTPAIENSGTTPTASVSIITVTPDNDWTVRSTLLQRAVDALRAKREQIPPDLTNRIFLQYVEAGPIDPSEIFAWREDERPPLSLIKNAVLGPKSTIYPPNASAEITVDDVLAMQGVNRPVDNNRGKFFYGAIRYSDIFKHSHITKYCWRIDGYRSTPSGESPFPTLCTHWNCTDDACTKDKEQYEQELARFRRKHKF